MGASKQDPLARIAAVVGGAPGELQPLVGGVSAQVRRLHIRGGQGPGSVVLRSGGAAWKDGRSPVQTEHELLVALWAAGFPVPEPLHLDPGDQDGPILVLPFIDHDADGFDPVQLAQVLDRLHSFEPGALGLPELPTRTDPLPELLEYLPAELDSLRPLLLDLNWEPEREVLLHGDYWPGNVLWRDGRIEAVIDWEDAALGDPLADVAQCRLELLWRQGEEAMDAFTTAYPHPLAPLGLALWELLASSGALAFMDRWGLEPAVEAKMRDQARQTARRAGAVVAAG